MDYEKKNKAALNTATQWIKDGCTDKEKICLECVFPELRESEDERIRRELVAFFNEMRDTWHEIYWHDLKVDDILAYLEKQKEQKPADLPPGFYFIDLDGNRYYSKEFRYGDMKMKVVEKEQKPAEWSATDKAFIKDCAHVLDKNGYEACAERLLSMFPVNPTEWSEEDEKKMEDLVGLLAIFEGCSTVNVGTAAKYNDWLNSFRSRLKSSDSWKPSDEQMIALYNMIPFVKSVGGPSEAVKPLESLYEDLKKL